MKRAMPSQKTRSSHAQGRFPGIVAPGMDVLMVAERLNPRLRTAAVLGSSSGRYLRRCLPLNLRVTLVNAAGPGAPSDQALASMASSRAVVGLGRVACQRLCSLGIRHTVAPHPQWARRFGGPLAASERWYRTLLALAIRHAADHP